MEGGAAMSARRPRRRRHLAAIGALLVALMEGIACGTGGSVPDISESSPGAGGNGDAATRPATSSDASGTAKDGTGSDHAVQSDAAIRNDAASNETPDVLDGSAIVEAIDAPMTDSADANDDAQDAATEDGTLHDASAEQDSADTSTTSDAEVGDTETPDAGLDADTDSSASCAWTCGSFNCGSVADPCGGVHACGANDGGCPAMLDNEGLPVEMVCGNAGVQRCGPVECFTWTSSMGTPDLACPPGSGTGNPNVESVYCPASGIPNWNSVMLDNIGCGEWDHIDGGDWYCCL
jgi:hypothetical protein